MIRLVLLVREDDLNSLLGNVRVKFHFPLTRPVSNSFQVIHELGLGFSHIPNLNKNGRIVFSPAVQLLNIHQLDDMLKLFLKIADGNWGEQFDVSWLSQVWYPKICNYDTAPKEYRLQAIEKVFGEQKNK